MAFGFTSGGIAMTSLRQRMTEDMPLRGLAPATQQAYLRYVEQLAVFTGKSPDLVTDQVANGTVTFRYTEGKTGTQKRARLSVNTFIGRFLAYVLPKEFVKV